MTVRDLVDLYEGNKNDNSVFIFQRLVNNTEVPVSDLTTLLSDNHSVDTEFVYSFRFCCNRLEVVI